MGCCGSDNCETEYSSIYDITVNTIDGEPVQLSQYRGKVLIIVNVASRWGKSNREYKQLVQVHEKFRDRDFEILAFPCNQFLYEESGSAEKIKRFVSKFNVQFPVFEKINVNGRGAHPLYKYLRFNSRLNSGRIGWNFGKFLIDKEGNIVKYYGLMKDPLKFTKEIEKLLQWMTKKAVKWPERAKVVLSLGYGL